MIALIIAIILTPTILTDGKMITEPTCAEVIANSGYNTSHDIHAHLTDTPLYIQACFPERLG